MRLLSLRELPEKSGGVSVHSWRLWIRQGKIPSVKLGTRVLIREEDFLNFIEANTRGRCKE